MLLEACSWQDVLTLTEPDLSVAIAEVVYGWHPLTEKEVIRRTGCTHQAPDGGLYGVEPYSESWDLTMALSHRCHIWTQPRLVGWAPRLGNQYDGWEVCCEGVSLLLPDGAPLVVHTEAEERVARCRLALWRAVQSQGVAL